MQKKRDRTFILSLQDKKPGNRKLIFQQVRQVQVFLLQVRQVQVLLLQVRQVQVLLQVLQQVLQQELRFFFAQPTKETELKRKRNAKSFFIAMIIFVV
jgi:hypothetical protein